MNKRSISLGALLVALVLLVSVNVLAGVGLRSARFDLEQEERVRRGLQSRRGVVQIPRFDHFRLRQQATEGNRISRRTLAHHDQRCVGKHRFSEIGHQCSIPA